MLMLALMSALQVKPQAIQRNPAWLSREFLLIHPQALHRRLVYAALTISTRPRAFSRVRRTSRPQPWAKIARLRPDLAATFLPGFSAVPLAERVMVFIRRSSNLITSNRRARPVETFSHQSLRRSASRARILAM